ncbi:hypothetical protein DL767_001444 [Monosporascus sp. MG133]|nr:hypothetical protein DL767_001444 [Monosporascus sp. MG133]
MLGLLSFTLLFTAATTRVSANTEKTIFLGPPTVNLPSAHPSLDDLQVHTLTPDNWQVRTHLEAQFPSFSYPSGKPAWLILDELTEGQRYEVRVCWAATVSRQAWPRSADERLLTPSSNRRHLDSIHANDHEDTIELGGDSHSNARPERESSALFLRVLVAADYFTTNKTLMANVPPVYVDIILDPFILNILPRSLVPTVAYIIVVATITWFIARGISSWVRGVAAEPGREKKD